MYQQEHFELLSISSICLPKRIDPESLWIYRITKSDVTSHSFIEAKLSEDSKRRGKTTLQIFTLFILVGKLWWSARLSGDVATL